MANPVSKPATTFTLTTSASPAGGFAFGGSGDKTPASKPSLFGISSSTPSFSFATSSVAPTTGLFGSTPVASTATIGKSLGFAAPIPSSTTNTSSLPQFSLGGLSTTTTSTVAPISSSSAPGTGFQLGSNAASTPLSLAGTPASTAAASVAKISIPQGTSFTNQAAIASTTVSTSGTTIAPTSSSNLTYNQLEDQINKWTLDLEEQGKHFINQTKQMNAWDSLLIQNGDKIKVLNDSIERVKQQQQQLDQELDFVLAQQKELEELVGPLEKELACLPQSTDQERNRIYQLAESMDSQMKQMSEDLKGIIEHLNESNKEEDANDPVTQISRILNAHMNSLQWVDRNTAQISSYLEQISKMQDMNRRNNGIEI
ncbi:hypothetical protein WA026_005105 [Henosepilachna vigintioctopunctata]|uniref:Nucleoporin NSP1-like C-terminal domain-containing protein n=1 Tax=Henosepilachna vigintioctopunctata TaxID=420089 RepID=A0AAW1UMY6_9CUCU